MRIFVGASSREEIPEKYREDCRKLLEVILKDHDLVFGASSQGLMGMAYEIAKKNHREVVGICPEYYRESLKDLDCDQESVTDTMIQSTLEIYQTCDVMILLPGGFGSLYEFFLANYCKICKEIKIPVILYNSCGYYDPLLSFIENIYQEHFIREKELGNYIVTNDVEKVVQMLEDIR